MKEFAANLKCEIIQNCLVVNADCFEWLDLIPENSISAVVTDPPYGLREFATDHVADVQEGEAGAVWQSFRYSDGAKRALQPCFSSLTFNDKKRIKDFFQILSSKLARVVEQLK